MPSDEFVRRMRNQIEEQKPKIDSLREEKLHNARVLATRGPHIFDELYSELVECLKRLPEISITQRGPGGLQLGYGSEKLDVSVNSRTALIQYRGQKEKIGQLEPRVAGERIVYTYLEPRVSGEGRRIMYTYSERRISNVADIAESLIELLVQRR